MNYHDAANNNLVNTAKRFKELEQNIIVPGNILE